ncbi:RsmE family RNA methyltransferase [Phycisphaera mikurensis]|uniref:Ribosomal RNA small subunit methyltransferase E n=1 Tax=Phycisphaera mikurensis (strain NBRC 102666 / KCTC 22515 / FYK2301M01) TaxID=1142394 RepID=I0IB40_PHYMF|nr:RsmE family RNA methyltransferase [Phycisphaera mikurensis]MBB6442979.1 16S rRNA (uracil1498-N3)-methyltransferase [Phycisphaera mikurensis]BAM02478.1 putative RNA methyltransferase [Phycisphaera mikurensis NBRC 102666]
MPPTFVLPELASCAAAERVALPREEAVHAARVLRLRAGDQVTLIDGVGTRAEAEVAGVERGVVTVWVGARSRPPAPKPAVRVLAAPPKGARAEAMVDGLAQLGVAAWVPLLTDRGEPDGSANRRRRWERAAAEAAKQCGRAAFLRVEPAAGLAETLRPPAAGLRVLADPAGERPSPPPGTAAVDLFVGPEGGFTDAERRRILDAGAAAWRLGPHVLRIETAALAGAAIAARGPTPV